MIKIYTMNNSTLKSLGLILIWAFVVVLWMMPQITKFTNIQAEKESLVNKEKTLDEEYNKLKKIDEELKNDSSEFEKYTKWLKENELVSFIYSKIEELNKNKNSIITIKDLSITPAQINSMQFLESNIQLTLQVPTEFMLKNVLKMLNKNDEYKFFITSLTYDPNNINSSDWQSSGFSVTIPLKVFYK